MVRGYYIHHTDLKAFKYDGVARKISDQIKALNNSGVQCKYLKTSSPSTFMNVKRRLPFTSSGFKYRIPPDIADVDYVYIRKTTLSRDFIPFVMQMKSVNGDLLIILEIPTYPYDSELKTIPGLPLLLKDILYRNHLNNCVDRIVTCSNHEKIFGIDTIRIINAIDLSRITARKPVAVQHLHGRQIDIICVANFARWHGIDRIIEGLAAYYESGGDRWITLHLVGDGRELRTLFDQAKRLKVLEHIEFYGQCYREEMDILYDRCSLAIASLGLHRIGLSIASTLKTREYLAKGMPFVYSGEIDVFLSEPVDFCMQVPADESLIDIRKLVHFHDELYAREPEDRLVAHVRDYAERNVSVEKGMANVIEYIKENCGE